jgi:hypothetical protein
VRRRTITHGHCLNRSRRNHLFRILIVDDHARLRDGLPRIFEASPGLSVAGEAVNGEEAVIEVREGGFEARQLFCSS